MCGCEGGSVLWGVCGDVREARRCVSGVVTTVRVCNSERLLAVRAVRD